MVTSPAREDDRDRPGRFAPVHDHRHDHPPGSARAALSYPTFRRMWTASFASTVGTWMQNVALPAYIYERTGKAAVVGLLVFAQLGPLLLLSIPGGVIADRVDRRRWLVLMQVVQLVFSAALVPLAAAEAPVWSLILVALGVGIGNALNAPAWGAMLPLLVRREDLAGSVAMNSAALNGSRVIGPILVALLMQVGVTTAEVFAVNAATYLFVIAALLRTELPRPNLVTPERGWRQLTAGHRLARANPAVNIILLALTSFSFVSLVYVGLFPAVANGNFGIDEDSALYQWLYAVWGLGACLGALAVGTVFVRHDKRTLIRAGFAAFGVSLAAFAIVREPIGAFVTAFPLGFAYFATTTSMSTVMQSSLADDERGRVFALWFMAFGGTVPLGNLAFGPLMDAIGARWVLLGGAAWALWLAKWCDVAGAQRRAAATAVTAVAPVAGE